jgi:hypothetical protein
MKIVRNEYENLFAVPQNHPVTCANPSPWKIIEMRIEHRDVSEPVIFIRGEKSMWFRADQCFCDDSMDECLDYMKMKNIH